MSKFNWDDIPEVKPAPPAPKSGKFNWDDIPEARAANAPKSEESMGKKLVRATIDNVLPIGGAVAAGLVATPETLGFGTIPAAAGGYAAGKQGARLLNKYLLGDDGGESSVLGIAKQTGSDLIEGGTLEMGGQIAGKAIGKGIQVASEIPVVQKATQAVSDAGSYISSKLGKAGTKVGELLTGVPEKEIQTYAQHADEIKQMAKASDNNTYVAADQMRSNWADKIKQTRQDLNGQISSALSNNTANVESKPIVEQLNSAKLKINEKLYPEQVAQIDGLISKIENLAEDGQLSLSHANDVKKFLQDQASSAYKPGAVFPLGTESAKAAKSGAAVARKIVNDAEPLVKNANESLANLHDIEDSINLNLLKDGKPEASILAAGSGGNARNAQGLKDLGEAAGHNMVGDAEKLAAMRTFGSPKLMAADSTGKAAGRIGLAAGLGYVVGGPVGGVLAAGLTSPMALRTAIDAGRIGAKELSLLASSVEGKSLLNKALLMEKGSSEIGSTASKPGGSFAPTLLQKASDKDSPKKGPDKWANDGAQKIIEHKPDIDPKLIEDAKKSKKGRELLIQASDLHPGSRALNKIIGLIDEEVGE